MTANEHIAPPPPVPASRELDLFAFVLLLLRNLWLILACGLIAFLVMAVRMVRAKSRFASTAVIIVPQGNIKAASLASQLSLSTVDLLGGGFELYRDILESRDVADSVIADEDLKKAYGTDDMATVEGELGSLTTIQTQPEGLIRVTVEDTDPNRAADIANDYFHQLDRLNSRLVLTNEREQSKYLKQELTREKDALEDAEVALKQVQEASNGLTPAVQASSSESALDRTRAQLQADRISLDALLTGATEQNPEVIRLRSQISGLASQVQSLQQGQASTLNGTPTSQVPAQALEFVRRQREVTFHETLFDMLEKEYQASQEQESKSPSIVQVLDPAIPSHHKAWPPRTYYCLLAGVVGLVFGVFLVGLKAVVVAYGRNPQNAERLRQLKTFWRKK